MSKGVETDIHSFLRRYDNLARAKVHAFLAKNVRQDSHWLREDLLQACRCGIVQAHKTFDSSRGIPERAFVALSIEHALLQEFDKTSHVSSGTLAQLGRINRDKSLLESLFKRPVSKDELADFLSMTEGELDSVLQHAGSQDEFDDEIGHLYGYSENGEIEEAIFEATVSEIVATSLNKLTARERKILEFLYVEELSLEKAGRRLGIRKQSVLSAREKILAKFRRALEDALMFTAARRLIDKLPASAIDCKNLVKHQITAKELLNGPSGLLAVPYMPSRLWLRVVLNMLCTTPIYGKVVGGGWTNGYVYCAEGFGFKTTKATISIEHKAALLMPGESVLHASLLFHASMQRIPIVALTSASKTLLFMRSHLDALINRVAVISSDIELRLDVMKTGVVLLIYGEPVAYLARAVLPSMIEPLMVAHAEKFCANCRN